MNVHLRRPTATTNYVVFLPGSESGSEPKSRSMSTQSERVTRDLRIKTHYKNPLDTLLVSTGGLKGKKIIDHRVRGQNVIFCLLTTKKSTESERLSLAPN